MSSARRVLVVRRPAGTVRRTGSARRRRPTRGSRRRTGRIHRPTKDWWPALLVLLAVVVGVAWDAQTPDAAARTGICHIPGTTMVVTAEQATNAEAIAGVAEDRGLPLRAVVIALATAQQESGLRNLDYGDRDSLGLFQQRPSQGWGTPAQVQDPEYAAGKFFDHLVGVPNWQTGRVTDVAQTVQRSAFPLAYERWADFGQHLATAIDEGTLACQ